MGVLDRFEKGIERAVNGAFAKAFRSEVQPVEIASALRRECDERASIVGRDRTIAPNSFVVELGQADHERLGEWETALGDELAAAVHEHARQQRYAFVGPVRVTFEQAGDLDTGVFRVRSTTARPESMSGGQASGYQPGGQPPQSDQYGRPASAPSSLPAAPPYPGAPPAGYQPPAAPGYAPSAPSYSAPSAPAYPAPSAPAYPAPSYEPSPDPLGAEPTHREQPGGTPSWASTPAQSQPQSLGVLEVDGRAVRIERPVTTIGRAVDVDIVLDDPGVSRRHAEVHVVDGRARVIDLGSTNGTFVDGERVHAGSLADGSTITVGRTRITYRSGQW